MRWLCSMMISALFLAHQPVAATEACPASDQVEKVLVLMSQRLALADDVARYKWNTHADIEDSAREQLIITKLVADATAQGLPATWSEQFFRAQIDSSKMRQKQHFDAWRQAGQGAFAGVPDLNTQTRPKLYALMTDLIAALAKAWQPLAQPGCHSLVVDLLNTRYAKPEYVNASQPLLDIKNTIK